jgi:zinc and cadmium transporter
MSVWLLSLVSVIIVSLISLIGVFTLLLSSSLLKKILLYLVSFSAGGLFGDAFIHLIPEAIEESGPETSVSVLIIIGIITSLAVERFLQWRHCHVPTSDEHPHSFAYMNLYGDAVHNFIDGLIIGSSYLANVPLGISTTLAVVSHEIPQELGDFSVLIHGGFKKNKALTFNFLTALTAIVGVVVSLSMGSAIEGFVPLMIPFAAGNFIYIAGSDLIPELRKDEPEPKKALVQMVTLVFGVMIMLLFILLE